MTRRTPGRRLDSTTAGLPGVPSSAYATRRSAARTDRIVTQGIIRRRGLVTITKYGPDPNEVDTATPGGLSCCGPVGDRAARRRGAGNRRFGRSQGRGEDRARGPAVSGPVRQDRQRGGHRHHAVGRRAGLLPGARGVVYPARHLRRARTTRRSAPSRPSARTWPCRRGRRGSRSVRSPRTAPTGTRTGSAPSSRGPGCRS
jgi:hypothetical protein